MPNPSAVRRDKGLVRHTLHQLLHIDLVRFVVATVRQIWFTKVRKQLRTFDSDRAATSTVSHNLKGLTDRAVNRSMYLTRPLSTIERLPTDADILVIGPRTEGELLGLIAHGFQPSHIRGLDLISYSPLVDLGDMHAMPYPDDSFDAVILGWVLAYSEDRHTAAKEIRRVLRPGGVVAVGVEWSPESDESFVEQLGYLPGSADRIRDCDEILGYFDGVDEVLVREEPDHRAVGAMVTIFSLDKV